MNVTIDPTVRVAGLAKFWNGSGMHSDDGVSMPFYYTPVQQANMALIGAVPHDGCIWQRPHVLLGYVRVMGLEKESPVYDFLRFDAALDPIVRSGQKLIFELMGVPEGARELLPDFCTEERLALWRKFIAAVVRRLFDRYGADEVRSWLFECWNEPDNGGSKLPTPGTWGDEEVLAYYRACAAGLADVDPALRIGGPGSMKDVTAKCYQDFAREGLTKPETFRLDFLAYHHKTTPRAQRELAAKARADAAALSPRGRSIPFINDEADAEWAWMINKPHRAWPAYAAFIARQVMEFQLALRAGEGAAGGEAPSYRVHNDNAFLGGWELRTHFTWFGDRERFALVKKPAHNVMTLLAQLGDEQVAVTGADLDSPVGVLATRQGSDEVAVLICRWDDRFIDSLKQPAPAAEAITVTLKVGKLPFSGGTVTHYRIDNQNGHTHGLWKALGSPATPDVEQLARLRAAQELEAFGSRETLKEDAAEFTLTLPLPAVHLIVIRAAKGEALPPPQRLTATPFKGLHTGRKDVLVAWRAKVRGVATYRIEKAPSAQGPWDVVKTPELIAGAYTDSIAEGEHAWYRVLSVDDAGRAGEASKPVRAGGAVAATRA